MRRIGDLSGFFVFADEYSSAKKERDSLCVRKLYVYNYEVKPPTLVEVWDSLRATGMLWKKLYRLRLLRDVLLLSIAGASMFALAVIARMYVAEPDFLTVGYADRWGAFFITTCFAFWNILAWVAFRIIRIAGPSRNLLVTIFILFFIGTALVCIFTPPIVSPDPYWNLLLVHGWTHFGYNPYTTTPNMLAGDSWALFVNHDGDISMHQGPLWVLFLSIPTFFSDSAPTAFIVSKMFMFAILTACGFIFWKIMDRHKIPEEKKYRLFVFLAWNYFIFQNVLIDGHSDVLVMFSILFAYLLLMDKRYAPSALMLVAGGFVKYVSWPLVIIPLWELVRERGWRRALPSFGIFFLIVSAAAACFAALFGFGFLQSSGFQHTLQGGFYSSTMLGTAFLINKFGFSYFGARLLGAVAALGAILLCLLFRKHLLAFTVPYLIIFLIGTGWFFPWYMLWIFPLLSLWMPEEFLVVVSVLLIEILLIPPLFSSTLFLVFLVGWVLIKLAKWGAGKRLSVV